MATTMKDVARIAGVSVVTVSRALNNKPDINKQTREAILQIAQDLNYTPHSLARSLITRKTNTIGIVIPNTQDLFYAQIVDGISKESREREYSVILCNSYGDPDEELKMMRLIREKRADGMLMYPVQEDERYVEALKKSPIPYVFLNRHTAALPSDYVINDNVHGAFLAMDELIKKGYRRIVYICARLEASSGRERIKGCNKAIKKHGLSSDNFEIMVCEETIQCCYDLVKQVLHDKTKKVDAFFLWDDRLAIGALKALLEEGIDIPKDIGMVGYDDIEISEYLYPALTTVRQPTYQIGATATTILLDWLEMNEEEIDHERQKVVLKPELIVRETT